MTDRDKSQLITKVPYYALCEKDKEKVRALDSRYSELIVKNDSLPWSQLRCMIKPYTIEVNKNSIIVVLSRNKKEAIKAAGIPASSVTKITVEYNKDNIVELVVPKTQWKRKSKVE